MPILVGGREKPYLGNFKGHVGENGDIEVAQGSGFNETDPDMDDDEAFLYGESKSAAQTEPGVPSKNSEQPAAPGPLAADSGEEAMDEDNDSGSDEDLEIILDGDGPQASTHHRVLTSGPEATATGTAATTSILPPGQPAPAPLPFPASSEPAPGFDATLPALLRDETSLIDVDIDTLTEKPWLAPGAHQADFFNYGFDETTWKLYCARQRAIRDQAKQDRENPYKAFAELPLSEAWASLTPELKGQMMQTILSNSPMAPMMMMGGAGGPGGMPGMPPMPMGMPGADAFGAADGPRGTKRLRGEDSNTSLDVASAEGGQFSGDQNGMGMPGMPMDMPMPQFSGNPEQMMMMMQQSGMDPSQMPNMDPYNSAQGGAGFSGNNHSTSARGGRGRGRGRGSNPFGIGVNPSARGRPLSGAAGRGAGATNDPDYAQEAASGGGGSPLPGNVPTGPRGKGGPPPSGPRGGAAWRSHQDKDRDNSNTSRGYTGSELDYGGGSNGDGRSSRSRRRHDDDEYDDSYRRRRSSRSPGRRGRSRSPVYDDYA